MSVLKRLFGEKKSTQHNELSIALVNAVKGNRVHGYIEAMCIVHEQHLTNEQFVQAFKYALKECGLERQLKIEATGEGFSMEEPDVYRHMSLPTAKEDYARFTITLSGAVRSAYRQKKFDTDNDVNESNAIEYMDTDFKNWIEGFMRDTFDFRYRTQNRFDYCNVYIVLENDNRHYDFHVSIDRNSKDIIGDIQKQTIDKIVEYLTIRTQFGFVKGKMYRPTKEEIDKNLTSREKEIMIDCALEQGNMSTLSKLLYCSLSPEQKTKIIPLIIERQDYVVARNLLQGELSSEDRAVLENFYKI